MRALPPPAQAKPALIVTLHAVVLCASVLKSRQVTYRQGCRRVAPPHARERDTLRGTFK